MCIEDQIFYSLLHHDMCYDGAKERLTMRFVMRDTDIDTHMHSFDKLVL